MEGCKIDLVPMPQIFLKTECTTFLFVGKITIPLAETITRATEVLTQNPTRFHTRPLIPMARPPYCSIKGVDAILKPKKTDPKGLSGLKMEGCLLTMRRVVMARGIRVSHRPLRHPDHQHCQRMTNSSPRKIKDGTLL